jgi:hypothetical protein
MSWDRTCILVVLELCSWMGAWWSCEVEIRPWASLIVSLCDYRKDLKLALHLID